MTPMKNMCPKACLRGGFTLIELLVVISIIMMLMSIMMPSLSRAREMGQRVVCQSNMRNLTLAWGFYAGDNDEKICSADTNWNTGGIANWVADGPDDSVNTIGGTKKAIEDGALWPYASETIGIYKCGMDQSPKLRSYAISRMMNGKTCNCEHDNVKPVHSIIGIKSPSNKMVFVGAESRTRWIEGSFCPVKQIDAVPPKWFNRASRNITARHADGVNLSYADFHCGYIKYEDRRTVELANWEIDAGAASGDNADLDRYIQMMNRW